MDVNSFVIGYNKGKASGGSMKGFHKVQFFNDDRTTLLYTVFVPTGANAMYAGETPVSIVNSLYTFSGFEPAPESVMTDIDCFAVYTEEVIIDKLSWETIAGLSADGTAQNYLAVGDTKIIHVEGTVGTLVVNGDYGVYIIGFDHNEELEGKGITFGTFKSALSNGKSLALVDGFYNKGFVDGTIDFGFNHWGRSNRGGWSGCDMRYDVLGSTDLPPQGYGAYPSGGRYGYDPTPACATSPVANTLMAAMPADLRAVMKPMTKYTNNKGDTGNTAEKVTASIDYLPLLAEFEINGTNVSANQYEKNQQKQYAYYADGKSKVKYNHGAMDTSCFWWTRSVSVSSDNACMIYVDGSNLTYYANNSVGLAPIFKV